MRAVMSGSTTKKILDFCLPLNTMDLLMLDSMLVPFPPELDWETPPKDPSQQLREYEYEHFLHARNCRRFNNPTSVERVISYCMRNIYFGRVLGDCQWAIETAKKRSQGLPHVPWEDFEEQRIAGQAKPVFLLCCTVLSILVFAAQLSWPGWDFKMELIPSEKGTRDEIDNFVVYLCLLWYWGLYLEYKLGSVKVAQIFGASAICGTLARLVFTPYDGAVGISGGVYGLLGASLANLCKHWDVLSADPIASPVGIAGLLVWDVYFWIVPGLHPFVDQFSLCCGFVLGLKFTPRVPHFSKFSNFGYVVGSLILSVPAVAVTTMCFLYYLYAVVFVLHDKESGIFENCKAIACINSFPWSLGGEDRCASLWQRLAELAASNA